MNEETKWRLGLGDDGSIPTASQSKGGGGCALSLSGVSFLRLGIFDTFVMFILIVLFLCVTIG